MQGGLGTTNDPTTNLFTLICIQLPYLCWKSSSMFTPEYFLPISSSVCFFLLFHIVFAKPKDSEMWPNHLSSHFWPCSGIYCMVWQMHKTFCNCAHLENLYIRHFVTFGCFMSQKLSFSSNSSDSSMKAPVSLAYWKVDMTKEFQHGSKRFVKLYKLALALSMLQVCNCHLGLLIGIWNLSFLTAVLLPWPAFGSRWAILLHGFLYFTCT